MVSPLQKEQFCGYSDTTWQLLMNKIAFNLCARVGIDFVGLDVLLRSSAIPLCGCVYPFDALTKHT